MSKPCGECGETDSTFTRRERIAASVLGGLVKPSQAYDITHYPSDIQKMAVKAAVIMADLLLAELDE